MQRSIAGRQEEKGRHAGKGSSFGTFGELLQGVLPEDNLDFRVALPLSRFSHALFVSDPAAPGLTVFPAHKQKSLTLAATILEHFALPPGGRLSIESELFEGRGMASSSADLVATARAVAACFGIDVPVPLLQQFMFEIEPSDGVMYDGVVAFYHHKVRLCKYLGHLPPLTIVAAGEGSAQVPELDRHPQPFAPEDRVECRRLLDLLAAAIRKGDMETVGRVATCSAQMNQKPRRRSDLGTVIGLCAEVGGLGVVAAHSGACAGILLEPGAPQYRERLQAARRGLRRLKRDATVFYSLVFEEGAKARASAGHRGQYWQQSQRSAGA